MLGPCLLYSPLENKKKKKGNVETKPAGPVKTCYLSKTVTLSIFEAAFILNFRGIRGVVDKRTTLNCIA